MAVTGLQRNVIAMAFWCKSDGGQHQGKLPPPKATQHRYYWRFITVLRRDLVVGQMLIFWLPSQRLQFPQR